MTARLPALALVVFCASTGCRQPERIVPGLTQQALMGLRVNMKAHELEAALGRPLEVIPRHAEGAHGKLFRWTYAQQSCRGVARVGWCEGWSASATVHAGEVQTVVVYRDNKLVFSCDDPTCPKVHDRAAFAGLPRTAHTGS